MVLNDFSILLPFNGGNISNEKPVLPWVLNKSATFISVFLRGNRRGLSGPTIHLLFDTSFLRKTNVQQNPEIANNRYIFPFQLLKTLYRMPSNHSHWLKQVKYKYFLGQLLCLTAYLSLYLHCVFHGIRFKVNKDWLSWDNQFFLSLSETGCSLWWKTSLPDSTPNRTTTANTLG